MRISGRTFARGLLHTTVVVLALAWSSTLVTLVVLWYAPPEDPKHAMSFWQTGVLLAATLPLLIVLARWALRPERRIGPQVEDDVDPEAAAAGRPHQSLHGETPPPPRW